MRFLHTADWQLGMTRRYLSTDAQARFTAARLDAVRELGRIAAAEHCAFILVCGDVFESNLLSPQVIGRALEVMRAIPVPIFLLPGNHDPMDAASIYQSAEFVRRRPDNVHVLAEPGIHPVELGVEIVAAPWDSKHPLTDLAWQQCSALPPADGVIRILAAHGAVDSINPDPTDPALIHLASLEEAVDSGRIQYVGLGDRHSLTQVDDQGAVWYPGAPEVTAFDEVKPGHVLVVDIDDQGVRVQPHRVGSWRLIEKVHPLNGSDDVAELSRWLDEQPDKDRVVLKLGFRGTITVRDKAELDDLLETSSPLFAGIQAWERRAELAIIRADSDFDDLGLTGFAASALKELSEAAARGGAEAEPSQDAMSLLYRLVRSAA